MVLQQRVVFAMACVVAVGTSAQSASTRVPVLVELFTSEGCSSCPPADEALDVLWRTQPVEGVEIIPLSFHVDYWNNLGWKDPFSSALSTERQSEYDRALGQGLFTPQVVVNGQASYVGGSPDLVEKIKAVRRASGSTRIELSATEGTSVALKANVPGLSPTKDDVLELWIAVIESGIQSEVRGGENAGRTLRLAPVVRRFERMGVVTPGTHAAQISLAFPPSWRRENLRAVVVLQERKSRRVLGVAAASI